MDDDNELTTALETECDPPVFAAAMSRVMDRQMIPIGKNRRGIFKTDAVFRSVRLGLSRVPLELDIESGRHDLPQQILQVAAIPTFIRTSNTRNSNT